ncbi:Cation/calcium exchanger [Carpediemonas membranifera]|uniref:Cation/calcium exchanger n=1 Tax=Carpediemonas membranifera TaxID=201153 RepID=A0A8J6BUS2_9EUKA|nr:Cation/calcium exchanger [Carpediemonas membranifera]|eukprot:KAG9390651.1 Cation/calcium exchanger [Carpediemonas membranifera]
MKNRGHGSAKRSFCRALVCLAFIMIIASISALARPASASNQQLSFGQESSSLDLTAGSKTYACEDVHTFSGDQCAFVKHYCAADSGLINHLAAYYCVQPILRIAVIVLMSLFLVFIFIVLGSTADKWFCPCLEAISDLLRLPPEVAGVTFLSFGNCAPDIFSILASIGSASSIAFGEIMGSGCFVGLAVLGVVTIATKPKLQAGPFLRDAGIYAVCMTLFGAILIYGTVHWWMGFAMIALYFIYILIVIFGTVLRWIKARGRPDAPKRHKELMQGANDLPLDVGEDLVVRYQHGMLEPLLLEDMEAFDQQVLDQYEEAQKLPPHHKLNRRGNLASRWWHYCKASVAFPRQGLFGKIVYVIELPLTVVRHATILPGDLEMYHPVFVGLAPVAIPAFIAWSQGWWGVGLHLWSVLIPFPLPVVLLCVPLAVAAFLVSARVKPGEIALGIMAFGGFAMAVLWLQTIANELVALLKAFGTILMIPDSVLGLTVLAWGNSVGDLVSDLSVARNGSPEMAFGAIFGAPVMNLLIGIGISFISQTVLTGENLHIVIDLHGYIAMVFLLFTLWSHLIVISIHKFRSPRYWGVVSLLVYVLFMLCQLGAQVIQTYF